LPSGLKVLYSVFFHPLLKYAYVNKLHVVVLDFKAGLGDFPSFRHDRFTSARHEF
jgi:hypothetical protein